MSIRSGWDNQGGKFIALISQNLSLKFFTKIFKWSINYDDIIILCLTFIQLAKRTEIFCSIFWHNSWAAMNHKSFALASKTKIDEDGIDGRARDDRTSCTNIFTFHVYTSLPLSFSRSNQWGVLLTLWITAPHLIYSLQTHLL